MPITRGQAGAMIEINNIAVAALASGDDHFAIGCGLNGRAVSSVNVLTFMIFPAAPAERVSATADAALKRADHRPQRRNRAMATDHVFVNPHLALKPGGLRFQR